MLHLLQFSVLTCPICDRIVPDSCDIPCDIGITWGQGGGANATALFYIPNNTFLVGTGFMRGR
jgi:hypothetical protein